MDQRDAMPGHTEGKENKSRQEGMMGGGRQDCSINKNYRDSMNESKAVPAHRIGVKQNQKMHHCLHHHRSGRLHVDAMSLIGIEGSSILMIPVKRHEREERLFTFYLFLLFTIECHHRPIKLNCSKG
jgi:hypothetical protein